MRFTCTKRKKEKTAKILRKKIRKDVYFIDTASEKQNKRKVEIIAF